MRSVVDFAQKSLAPFPMGPFIFTLVLFGASALLYAQAPPQEIVDGYEHTRLNIPGDRILSQQAGKAVNSNDYPLLIAKGLPRNVMLYPIRYLGESGHPSDFLFFQDEYGAWMNYNTSGIRGFARCN